MDVSDTLAEQRYEARLIGDFTFADNQSFRSMISRIESEAVRHIVLDFSSVSYIDSAALGMLLLLRESVSEKGVSITLRGSTGQTRKMFTLSHFDSLFDME